MGSGKSTLGRGLAAQLGLPFVDVDARVEAEAGCRISNLFEHEGEAGFRKRETRALLDALREPPAVIATGGGAVLAEANRTAMRSAGIVIYLQVDSRTQLDRLSDDSTRPLLATPDRAQRLASLQAQREPLYLSTAHLCFNTSLLPADAAVTALLEQLNTFKVTLA